VPAVRHRAGRLPGRRGAHAPADAGDLDELREAQQEVAAQPFFDHELAAHEPGCIEPEVEGRELAGDDRYQTVIEGDGKVTATRQPRVWVIDRHEQQGSMG